MYRFDYYVPHFITHVRGTCIVVTSDLISKVLHIPRVKFADYLNYECLRNLHLGVTVKTPLAQALQKVRGSLTW